MNQHRDLPQRTGGRRAFSGPIPWGRHAAGFRPNPGSTLKSNPGHGTPRTIQAVVLLSSTRLATCCFPGHSPTSVDDSKCFSCAPFQPLGVGHGPPCVGSLCREGPGCPLSWPSRSPGEIFRTPDKSVVALLGGSLPRRNSLGAMPAHGSITNTPRRPQQQLNASLRRRSLPRTAAPFLA